MSRVTSFSLNFIWSQKVHLDRNIVGNMQARFNPWIFRWYSSEKCSKVQCYRSQWTNLPVTNSISFSNHDSCAGVSAITELCISIEAVWPKTGSTKHRKAPLRFSDVKCIRPKRSVVRWTLTKRFKNQNHCPKQEILKIHNFLQFFQTTDFRRLILISYKILS